MNVGMPVSWQMGPSSWSAMSILVAMMPSACADWVPGVSVSSAKPIAARTSGGRFVDVCVISSIRLLVNPFIVFRFRISKSLSPLERSGDDLVSIAHHLGDDLRDGLNILDVLDTLAGRHAERIEVPSERD